jgi:NAD dependent epimerase/dehydratase family enzyme
MTGPQPVTNAEFSRALGRAMGRPSRLPAPAFALRLALGEMADALLLGGQRVLPEKAQRHGFTFRFGTVEAALEDMYRQAPVPPVL